MKQIIRSKWLLPAALLFAFLASVFFSRGISRVLALFLPSKGLFAERTPLTQIAVHHVALVLFASGLALAAAVGAAVATRFF